MRIALLGAPGSGKGTQAKLLAQKYHIPHLSSTDVVRDAIAAESALGLEAKAAMDAGTQTDEIVLRIMQERLGREDVEGYLLDGFPRSLYQAQTLDAALEPSGRAPRLVILIEVEVELLIERLTGRRTCESCGATYNIYVAPSRLGDICDKCGGNLRHRADDSEETISNRLRAFEVQTRPMLDYYRERGRLRVVQGVGDIDDIFTAICRVVDTQLSEAPPVAAARPTPKRPALGKAPAAAEKPRAAVRAAPRSQPEAEMSEPAPRASAAAPAATDADAGAPTTKTGAFRLPRRETTKAKRVSKLAGMRSARQGAAHASARPESDEPLDETGPVKAKAAAKPKDRKAGEGGKGSGKKQDKRSTSASRR